MASQAMFSLLIRFNAGRSISESNGSIFAISDGASRGGFVSYAGAGTWKACGKKILDLPQLNGFVFALFIFQARLQNAERRPKDAALKN
jgi:hypothetical protein